jgi:hypothetical protein
MLQVGKQREVNVRFKWDQVNKTAFYIKANYSTFPFIIHMAIPVILEPYYSFLLLACGFF